MATISKWSGVTVAVESAAAAVKTITGITKASPAVVTSATHGYANGNIVKLSVLGMSQLNDRVVRVSGVTASTFDLEGIDSTLYSTFSSGTASLVTFGTSVTIIRGLSASGGEPEFEDISTIHDTNRSEIPTTNSAAKFDLEMFWDPADVGYVALKAAADAQALLAMEFVWPTQRRLYYRGYVAASGLPTGQAQGVVTTSGAFTIQGRTTQYAS